MNIKPLAFESMGSRGMATSVVTKGCIILIDPGVNLASQKFGLPPHPLELERKKDHWAKIKDYAEHSDIIVLTHYHFGHFNPEEPEIFRGKTVFLKDPQRHLSSAQRSRAEEFIKKLEGLTKELFYADGEEFTFGGTKLRFSPAVSHGPDPKVGHVVQVSVQEDIRFLHTSDIQGPCTEAQASFVLKEDPQVLFCDGPFTAMLGRRYSVQDLHRAIGYLLEILGKTQVQKMVLDHHLLRELRWKNKMEEVFFAAQAKEVAVLTAAEFAGVHNDLLEAGRKRLYGR